MKKNKKLIIIISVVIILLLVTAIIIFILKDSKKENDTQNETPQVFEEALTNEKRAEWNEYLNTNIAYLVKAKKNTAVLSVNPWDMAVYAILYQKNHDQNFAQFATKNDIGGKSAYVVFNDYILEYVDKAFWIKIELSDLTKYSIEDTKFFFFFENDNEKYYTNLKIKSVAYDNMTQLYTAEFVNIKESEKNATDYAKTEFTDEQISETYTFTYKSVDDGIKIVDLVKNY